MLTSVTFLVEMMTKITLPHMVPVHLLLELSQRLQQVHFDSVTEAPKMFASLPVGSHQEKTHTHNLC